MTSPTRKQAIAAILLPLLFITGAAAQDRSPWERPQTMDLPPAEPDPSRAPAYRPDSYPPAGPTGRSTRSRPNDAYVPPPPARSAWGDGLPGAPDTYPPAQQGDGYRPGPSADSYRTPPPGPGYGAPPAGYGAPYQPAPAYGDTDAGPPPARGPYADQRGYGERPPEATYSQNEVLDAGHKMFGSVSKGLANAIEYVFQQSGRPNGYILGEDAGGAFVAGLRYGEGVLYTKDAGRHRVYWQGPSLGYDFGGEGSKTMVLVYNLRDPSEIYNRFGGIEGSAYLIGGVSVQFQKYGDVVLAPIRSGLGLRLGANVGYLKYTRTPTWNPF